MPISGAGWELHIRRMEQQARNGRLRTIGVYDIYHDGQAQAGLSGTSVETKGPGDNATAGNGRRVQAGVYPLATHAGPHYVSSAISSRPTRTRHPSPVLDCCTRETAATSWFILATASWLAWAV